MFKQRCDSHRRDKVSLETARPAVLATFMRTGGLRARIQWTRSEGPPYDGRPPKRRWWTG